MSKKVGRSKFEIIFNFGFPRQKFALTSCKAKPPATFGSISEHRPNWHKTMVLCIPPTKKRIALRVLGPEQEVIGKDMLEHCMRDMYLSFPWVRMF